MKQNISISLAIVLATSFLSGCMGKHMFHQSGQNDSLTVPNAPAELQAQPGHVLTLEAKGTGVQIYTCTISAADPTKFEWHFKAPEADLTDSRGKTIGKHYAGPTWEANDGSKVIGQVKASSNESDPKSIPSLLLNAVSNSGTGIFAKTTTIQRLYPVSGKAPADGCDGDHLGKEARVSYTAQYFFYN
jgi:hypothetical protein